MLVNIQLSLPFRLAMLVLAFTAMPAVAQPGEACDGTQELDGTDSLPQSFNVAAPVTADMDMTGTGCSEEESDIVVCFTPEFSCTLNIDCIHSGAAVSVNVFEGPCTTAPSSCLASNSGSGFASTIASLTGGTNYCIVCETDLGLGTINLDFDVDSGSCGALPVELQGFSVSGDDAATDEGT